MSLRIMDRIWWRQDLTMTEKFIAIALADQASDEGVCWPTMETIAYKCSCTVRTVQNAVKALEGKMLMARKFRTDQSSYFIFNLSNLPVCERPTRVKERGPHQQDGTGESPAGDLFGTGESGSGTGESGSIRGEGDSPRTVIEPSIEPSSSLEAKKHIVKLFTEAWQRIADHHAPVPSIGMVDETREKAIIARVKEWTKGKTLADSIAVVEHVMLLVHESHFLTGRKIEFKATFDWLITKKNFRKVMEGNYDRNGNRPVQSTERNIDAAKDDAAELLRRRRQQRGGPEAQPPC